MINNNLSVWNYKGIRIELCGLVFDHLIDDTLMLRFHISNECGQKVMIAVKNLTINNREQYELVSYLGSFGNGCRDDVYFNVTSHSFISYFRTQIIDFSLQISDINEKGMYETNTIHIECDPFDETFGVTLANDLTSDEGSTDENAYAIKYEVNSSLFESIPIVEKAGVHIKFCGLVNDRGELHIRLWVSNSCGRKIDMCLNNITINGVEYEIEENFIDSFEDGYYDYIYNSISYYTGIFYYDIKEIKLAYTIEEIGAVCYYDTQIMHIILDSANDQYTVECI